MHHSLEVEKFTICFIVTSDAVSKGLKPDEIKPIADNIASICNKAVLQSYVVVPNDVVKIRELVYEYSEKCDVIVVTGGTGISRRDVSIEAVEPLASKTIPGFGELFRALSYREIGVRAYLSRASAYVVKNSLVVVVPGNPSAVKLAIKDILCALAPHAVYEIRR